MCCFSAGDVKPADTPGETWTDDGKVYVLTTASFPKAEDAEKECKKNKGHLVHYVSADQLTKTFAQLKIDTAPGKGQFTSVHVFNSVCVHLLPNADLVR